MRRLLLLEAWIQDRDRPQGRRERRERHERLEHQAVHNAAAAGEGHRSHAAEVARRTVVALEGDRESDRGLGRSFDRSFLGAAHHSAAVGAETGRYHVVDTGPGEDTGHALQAGHNAAAVVDGDRRIRVAVVDHRTTAGRSLARRRRRNSLH